MLKEYFDDLSADLNVESERIKKFFATHRPSAGANREELVAKLLRSHILPSVGIETGLVLARSGELSNQSDIVLTDATSNGAIHGSRPIPLWLKEAVYGVIEVKSHLTPTEIRDSVKKCVRLKTLPSAFADSHGRQKVDDTLFCLWAFDAPKDLALVKANILSAIEGVPQAHQPDFVIVPGSFLYKGGHYFDISVNGQPSSSHRAMRLASFGGDEAKLLQPSFELMSLGKNSLTVFLYWLNSWLYAAGPRRPDIIAYYPPMSWGNVV